MYPNSLIDVSEAAIQKAQEILKAGPTEFDVRKDITSGSGFASYNLQPVAMLMQPVITPWRNMIPRVRNTRGGTSAEWRAIAALITKNSDPTVSAEGAKGNKLNYTAVPKSAKFNVLALGDSVTWDAMDSAVGFEGDLRSRAVTNTLFGLMMLEEIQLGFGRIDDFGSVTAPTLSTSASGGGIAAGTYKVYVRAITGTGDNTTTRGKKSTNATTSALTGSANVITAHAPVVTGAVQYEWYVDDGAGGTATLQATTGINSVSLTALTTSGQALPADNVANPRGLDGLVAQYSAAGSGAQILALATGTDGVGTDFTLDDIDSQNKAVWDNAKASPEFIWMNSTQRMRATALVLAANGAPTLFVKSDEEMAQLTGGYLLAKYINKATGRVQQIVTHPNLPDGNIVATSSMIPFPTGGDLVGIDIETSRDYQQVDYALTARQYDFEVFCRQALRVKYTGGGWLIQNIKSNKLGV